MKRWRTMSPSFSKHKKKVVLASYTTGARERLAGLLDDHGLKSLKLADSWQEALGARTDAALIVLPLDHGFTAPEVAVLTEQDMLGDRLVRRKKRRKSADAFLAELAALTPGRPGRAHGTWHRPLRGADVGDGRQGAARLRRPVLCRRRQALRPGREYRCAVALRRGRRHRDARPAGRRGLAAAQVADEGADPRDRRRADQDRRDPRHPRRPGRRSRRHLPRIRRPLPL